MRPPRPPNILDDDSTIVLDNEGSAGSQNTPDFNRLDTERSVNNQEYLVSDTNNATYTDIVILAGDTSAHATVAPVSKPMNRKTRSTRGASKISKKQTP